MLARKVLDLAEAQGLLDGKAIAELRRKLEETKFIVTPEAIAKVLVDHGHLTPFQARRLVAQALGPEAEAPPRPQPSVKRVAPPKKLPETIELTLAEDEQKTAGPSDEEIIDLEAAEPTPAPVHRVPAWKTDPSIPTPAGSGPVVLEPLADAGPLDDLASGSLVTPAPPASFSGRPLDKPPGRGRPAKNVWDSPLLLVGGGVLGVILIAFAVLLYALTRGSAAELLKQADAAYRSGAYTSAIAGYETFLKKYPDNPDASKARVFRGMAQIRQVSDDGKNPRSALQTARQVLPTIESEEQFHLARVELSTILPGVADSFATLAVQADETSGKEELVGLAGDAMELVNNPSYLPGSLRKEREQRIAGVLDKLKVAQRSIDQDKDLAAAIDKIGAAAAQGETANAYQVRAELLRMYPGLEMNSQLVAAIRHVGDKERELVQVSQPQKAALTDDPQAASSSTVIAYRKGPAAGGAAASPAFMLLEGAVYAFDMASGRVLWRRYVGYETIAPPVSIIEGQAADALVFDARRQELMRVQGASGKLLWRQPIGEAAAGPLVAGEYVIVTTRPGRVLQVDSASGKIVRTAQLPQGATVAAAVDARPGRPTRLVQLGEHSTLFVLAADSLACSETVYLGHKTGAILVPPVAVFDQVFICESPADDYSLFRIYSPDSKTKRLVPAGRPYRVKGRIVTPLATSGRRVAAMTDLGQIAVFEVDAASAQEPVRLIAEVEANERAPLVPYYELSGNRLWTATRRRTLLEVQAALEQFTRRWSEDQGDSFIAPIQLHDDTLIYVRRSPNVPAVLIAACKAGTGQTLWTTHLAAPIVAVVSNAPRDAVEVLTAEGQLFTVAGDTGGQSYLDKPAFETPMSAGSAILAEASQSADGATLVWTERQRGGRVYSYRVGSGSNPTATPLPNASAQAAAPTQMLAGRLLVPLTNGSVGLLEQGSGKQAAPPFLPPLAPGELPRWTRPAVRSDGTGFLISDGRGVVYSVALKDQPEARLELTSQTPTAAPIVSPLVQAGGTAFGLMRSQSSDALIGFDSQGTVAFEPISLQGRVQAGPFAIGELVIVAAEPEGLLCYSAAGKLLWQQAVSRGPLAGSPLAAADGSLLLIYQSGTVARIDRSTGEELATADVGQPLGGVACLIGQHVFLAGSDGTVHRVPLPTRP